MVWLRPEPENFRALYGGLHFGESTDSDSSVGQVCACDCACAACGGDRCSCTSIEHASHRITSLASLWEG